MWCRLHGCELQLALGQPQFAGATPEYLRASIFGRTQVGDRHILCRALEIQAKDDRFLTSETVTYHGKRAPSSHVHTSDC